MSNTSLFLDYEGFKALNEDQRQLHYEKILSDLIQFSDANKVLLKERKQIEEENRKLFDISVSSFPPNKSEEIEKERQANAEEMRKKDEILQKESSKANYFQMQLEAAAIKSDKAEKEFQLKLSESKTQYEAIVQKMESERNHYLKQIEDQTKKLLEQEQNIEEVVAENSRLMIEIFNLKRSK